MLCVLFFMHFKREIVIKYHENKKDLNNLCCNLVRKRVNFQCLYIFDIYKEGKNYETNEKILCFIYDDVRLLFF